MIVPARYGTAKTFDFFMVKRGVVDLAATADWTPATGDTKISKDSGNFANTTNNPSAIGGSGSVGWTLTLTAAEMQASRVNLQIVDSATKAVEDQSFIFQTMPAATYDALYGGVGTVNLIDAPVVASRTTQAFDSDATTHNVAMPATVHAGDLLIVIFANDGSDTVTTPTGWKLLDSTANSTVARASSYARIADGSEGGTNVNFVTSGSQQGSSIVLRIGAGTFFPVLSGSYGIAVGTAATGTSTTPDPPSVTMPWDAQNTLVISYYGADDQAQATAYPANYQSGTTKQGANATGASAGTAEQILAASAENPGTFTIASQEWVANTIAIRADRIGDSLQHGLRREIAQTGAAGSITLDALASATDSLYQWEMIRVVSGTGAGQSRLITAYVGSTKVATVTPNWTTNPDSTSEFIVEPLSRQNIGYLLETIMTAATAGIPDVNAKNWNNLATVALPLVPATPGRSLVVDAAGLADANVVKVGPTGSGTAQTAGDIMADTNDIQTRLPAALVSGRMDVSVGAMASGVLTATAIAADAITAAKVADGTIDAATFAAGAINAAAIATDAITAAKIAADAIGASELAADAVTEIQSGLSTLTAAGVRTAVGLGSANLDTQLAAIQADTDDIQARIPAALVSGRIDASVGAMAANVMTAAAAAADLTTELQTGLATAANLATVAGYLDTEIGDIKAKTDLIPAAPAAVGDIPTANQNADALLDRSNGIETGLTPRGALRLTTAASAGKLSGAATPTATIRNAVADSKDRIVATVDADGNRTAVTTDVT